MRRLIAAVGCVVALSLSAASSQTASGAAYLDIAEEFRSHPDDAIGRMLDLADDTIAEGLHEAARPNSVWTLPGRGAALLMHTDAGMYLLRRNRSAAWINFDRALTLADALATDPESAWFVHQWFLVVTEATKDDERRSALVARWHAQPWFAATDALDRGLAFEATGAQLGSPTLMRDGRTQVFHPDAFSRAIPFYERARAAELRVAAVHLGRIEMLRGNDNEARRLLVTAADGSHWPTTRYLANLFLGSLEERDDDRLQAERRYRLAIEAVPRAQSGRLALAEFLARIGRTAEAARAMAGPPVDERSIPAFDPWWSYLYPYFDRSGSYKMILTELHMAVRR